jgi:hypothetical protein
MTDLFDILSPSQTSNLPAPVNQARYQANTQVTISDNIKIGTNTSASANYHALILPPTSVAQPQPPRRSLIHWQILLSTSKGKLIWFQCKQKTAPDFKALNQLAHAIDQLSFESDRAVETALAQIAYTQDIQFLRGNFLDHSQWPVEAWQRDEITHTQFTSSSIRHLTEQRETIHQRLKQSLTDGLQSFSQTLNATVLQRITERSTMDFRLYNYIVAEQPIHQRNRLQALHSFPFLAQSITTDTYAHIRTVIDSGQPLAEALANHFGVSPALIRKLGSKPIPPLRGPRSQPEFLFPLLATLPLEKIPNSQTDWVNFHSLVNNLAEFIDQPINSPLGKAILIECLTSASARKIVLAPNWATSQQSAKHFLRALLGVTRFLYRANCSAADADANARSAITHIVSHLGMTMIIKCAKQWDLAYREAQSHFALSNSQLQGKHWPTLLPAPITIDGFVITSLANVESLVREGRSMNNCAATYAVECQRGHCQLWSLRSEGTRHRQQRVTVQTYVDSLNHGTQIIARLGQVEGYDNTPASDESKAVANQLINLLNCDIAGVKKYYQWQQSCSALSVSERLELSTTRTLYRALENAIETRFDMITIWDSVLKISKVRERLKELDSLSANGLKESRL